MKVKKVDSGRDLLKFDDDLGERFWGSGGYYDDGGLVPSVKNFMHRIGAEIKMLKENYELLYDLLAKDTEYVKRLEGEEYFKVVFSAIRENLQIAQKEIRVIDLKLRGGE